MKTFVSFDGLEMAYLDEGSGPCVVLLHGFASEHRGNWVAPGVVAALVRAGYRVIAPDARGHGKSAKPHDPAAYGNDAMSTDVSALLTHLDVNAINLAGYSMGSMVSSRLTVKEPRVKCLVLGGVGGLLGSSDRPRNNSALANALETDDPASTTDPVARAFRAFADSTGADRLALAAIQRAPTATADSTLGEIAVPTMVVTGHNDTLVGPPDALAARIPGATFTVVAGDHLTAVNDPLFASTIVSFFQSSGLR